MKITPFAAGIVGLPSQLGGAVHTCDDAKALLPDYGCRPKTSVQGAADWYRAHYNV